MGSLVSLWTSTLKSKMWTQNILFDRWSTFAEEGITRSTLRGWTAKVSYPPAKRHETSSTIPAILTGSSKGISQKRGNHLPRKNKMGIAVATGVRGSDVLKQYDLYGFGYRHKVKFMCQKKKKRKAILMYISISLQKCLQWIKVNS